MTVLAYRFGLDHFQNYLSLEPDNHNVYSRPRSIKWHNTLYPKTRSYRQCLTHSLTNIISRSIWNTLTSTISLRWVAFFLLVVLSFDSWMSALTFFISRSFFFFFCWFRSKAEVFVPVDAPRYANYYRFIFINKPYGVYSGLIIATASRK